MRSGKHTALPAFVLACILSALATFGFLLHWDTLMMVGAPGFAFGGVLTGGHQTTFAVVISSTIINVGVYFFVFLVLLGLINLLRRRK
jgi:hypothetical protein